MYVTRLLELKQKLKSIRADIRNAEIASARQIDSVELLAVSKTKPASDIEVLYELGCNQFGENYVQEAAEKIKILSHLPIIWHFIGKIQSNKTSSIASMFDWVHTVDRKKVADRLSNARQGLPLNVLIQVNVDNSRTKSGIALSKLDDFVEHLSNLPNLKVRGLMSIPDPSSEIVLRRAHQSLQEAFHQTQIRHPNLSSFDTLSMGMTNDLHMAISEGSTMVRIGTALFGVRTPKDSK